MAGEQRGERWGGGRRRASSRRPPGGLPCDNPGRRAVRGTVACHRGLHPGTPHGRAAPGRRDAAQHSRSDETSVRHATSVQLAAAQVGQRVHPGCKADAGRSRPGERQSARPSKLGLTTLSPTHGQRGEPGAFPERKACTTPTRADTGRHESPAQTARGVSGRLPRGLRFRVRDEEVAGSNPVTPTIRTVWSEAPNGASSHAVRHCGRP